MHIPEEKLKDLLLHSDILSTKIFDSASNESSRLGQSIVNILIGRGDITEKYLNELLEPYLNIPSIDLETVEIDQDVLESIPESLAKGKGLVPFARDPKTGAIKIGMVDPLDFDTIEYLRAKFNSWIDVFLITQKSLRFALKLYKKEIGQSFSQIISENVKKFTPTGTSEQDAAKLAEALPIVTILDQIIEHAVALNASDIHFEPFAENVLIRYRIDGVLEEILNLNKTIEPVLVTRVKILSGMRIDEHRTPQDGRFHFETDEENKIDVRVNVIPVMHGEKVEMRLLRSVNRPLNLDELGLSQGGVKIIGEEIKKPHGMILVTGPTGHGKTTTLYAILHLLNTPKVNITTIEDPIEYEIGRINQTQVNTKAGITFANGLRALLRQNPDIIMVGEIRDNETVEIAIQAALTGHLVLSSLHTNDAPSALPRLLDMGGQAFLISSTVNLVIAQRLVRRICNHCIASRPIDEQTKALILNQNSDKHLSEEIIPKTLYAGQGCNLCGHTGFQGQIGLFEVLKISDPIRKMVSTQVPSGEIRQQAITEGMVTMFEDGLDKVQKGITTIEEVFRVVQE